MPGGAARRNATARMLQCRSRRPRSAPTCWTSIARSPSSRWTILVTRRSSSCASSAACTRRRSRSRSGSRCARSSATGSSRKRGYSMKSPESEPVVDPLRVEQVFHAVAGAPLGEQTARLAQECGGNQRLEEAVRVLLAAARNPATAWDGTALDLEARHSALTQLADQTVGGFRLTERIGRGGMGTVYRGERADGEFTQQVAIKLIDAPMHDPEARRRFRAERQILAALNHPYIVTLLDGGLTTSGQAYLTMEFVEGVPITRYADERALSLEARLQLFIHVCSGVQHAHQNLVVHRDLKPSNILVTPQGVPMILDFGVAKLLGDSLAGDERTVTGLLQPLTPNYASPEQLRGLPVATPSDIYALGVLLYELLTNTRPYDTAGLPLDGVLDLVLKTDPVRPSAVRRSGEFPYDPRRLKGDLDAIVLKAMRQEPKARYTSAEALAEDIARFLAGRPVFAREHSMGYLLRKVAARHKGAVVMGAFAAVALLLALTVTEWQRRVANEERVRAEQSLAQVHHLANSLVFKLHEAVIGVPGATRARRVIVDEARVYLERLAREAPGRDELQIDLARAYRELGSILGSPGIPNLGDTQGALDSYKRGLAIVRPMVERSNPPRGALVEHIYGHMRISHTLASVAGRHTDSEQAGREALAAAARLIAAAPDDEEAIQLIGDANAVLAD